MKKQRRINSNSVFTAVIYTVARLGWRKARSGPVHTTGTAGGYHLTRILRIVTF